MAEQVSTASVMKTRADGIVVPHARAQLLPESAWSEMSAPRSVTGCVSEISSRGDGVSFHPEAFKRYAEVYGAYQAYLMPLDPLAAHDYELGLRTAPSSHRLGCLDEDFVDDTVLRAPVADEDIEQCGYLGWLHH